MPDSRPGVACIIDSDIIIDLLRAKRYARALLLEWSTRGPVAVSTISYLEVYQGMRQHEEAYTAAFLDMLTPVPVDVDIARRAGIILREMRSRGRTTAAADSIIAATAMACGTTLLTNNVGHYALPGLRIVRGLDSA